TRSWHRAPTAALSSTRRRNGECSARCSSSPCRRASCSSRPSRSISSGSGLNAGTLRRPDAVESPPMRPRHPIGLYILFVTEMWERFGFYCMEAVFVYYMKVSQYEFLRENSSRVYGWYLAGVYFAPFFGGLLAEWRFGYTLPILLGGLSVAV